MSSSNFYRGAQGEGKRSTRSRASTVFSSPSPQADSPSCTVGFSADSSSIGQPMSECMSCLSEPNVAGCCRFPANADERQYPSECMDLGCAEAGCDECSNHEDCCDDCVVDCGSECGFPFDCDELDIRTGDNYSLELFGDQTAQTFGFGRRLPQLANDDATTESTDFGKTFDNTTLATVPGYSMDQRYSSPKLQPARSTQSPRGPCSQDSPQFIVPSRPNECSPLNIPNPARSTTSFLPSSEYVHDSPDTMEFPPNAHHDHIKLPTEKGDSTQPYPPSLQCQWADSDGVPCGEIVGQGHGMHEHLRSAHAVKTQVYCRWVGCSVGVRRSSPHRFASSVERHTWGHSGYRPYKCEACNEGFAAASVRDEHFKNIHLRKKEFSCDMCSHQCTSATNLKRHKDDKHSAERYQCEFCNRHGKRRLFPRGPNLARHFRNCKYVQAQFAETAAAGKAKADWLPPGYKRGHHGMDRAKVTPPNYLPV